MKVIKSLVLAAASTLVLAAVAHAEDSAAVSDAAAHRAVYVYEGRDGQGKIVRLTMLDVSFPAFVRVSQNADATRYPQLDWTSKIGTGMASSLKH
jgi:hypothetical protein